MSLKSIFPILESLQNHRLADWRRDLIAGITVAVMLVPQGMAYAMLAGVPPIYGLYGGLVPLLLYAILGSSRHLSIGPVAISALLVLAGVSQITQPESPDFIALVILTGLLVGILQFLLGVLKLGFLVNFVSHPVIIGFTSAAAIIIAISQLKDVLGMSIPYFSHSYQTLMYALTHLSETHLFTLLLCLGSILLIITLRYINKSIPGAIIVLILGTAIVYFTGADQGGVEVVNAIPRGLPALMLPAWSLDKISAVIPTVLSVTIIGIVESVSIAKVIQARHRDYLIRPNQELIALGISKIGGAFFQAIPTSGSFTRSAVNDDVGAQSGFSSVFTVILIALTLVFLTPLFYYLPKAVLAAIILVAIGGLFDWKEARYLWKTERADFVMMLATFVITLGLGIEQGVFTGVLLSLGMVLYRSSHPHIAVLGKLPESDSYRNIRRFQSVSQPDDVLVIRFDDQLYFGNANFFQEIVMALAQEKGSSLKLVVIDASSIHDTDSTGMHVLEQLIQYFHRKKIRIYFSGFIGPVRDKLLKTGLMKMIGEKNQFLRIHDAITYHGQSKEGHEEAWSRNAIQSNFKDWRE